MQALQEIQIENNSELGAVVSSRVVANELEREHKNVKRDLEQILIGSDLSALIFLAYTKIAEGEFKKNIY